MFLYKYGVPGWTAATNIGDYTDLYGGTVPKGKLNCIQDNTIPSGLETTV